MKGTPERRRHVRRVGVRDYVGCLARKRGNHPVDNRGPTGIPPCIQPMMMERAAVCTGLWHYGK